eukprot:TRINITY_DN805_c0_g2_i2.p1 TRINITY_DN805_c0_g2~~TRINITY_DN805_c0_g2_i2.p1  ORF type:complete len:4436 (+),score=1940.78 TRINITY_DN805_c0_g2_i2:809-13309(+)
MPQEQRGLIGHDPQQSHFLPLEEFDNTELEPCAPQDWILMGKQGPDGQGTPAKSQYFYGGGKEGQAEEVKWTRCRVIEYDEDENSYLIRWERDDGPEKMKWVKRLNLIFDAEDEGQWKERFGQAWRLRDEAEAQMRLYLYVSGMPEELVTPIDEDQVDRILALVAAEFPLAHLHVIERAITEMRSMYSYGLKLAVFNYKFNDPVEQQRLDKLSLPHDIPPPPQPLDQLLGTVDARCPSYMYSRHYIEENLFCTHHLLYQTIFSIYGRWDQFAHELLCDTEMKGVPLPCELDTFKELQSKRVCKVSERLQEDWSVNTTATIQNELDEHFNFYEDDAERYRHSRMCRFFRMINLVMAYQMRTLITESIQTYTDFLLMFRVVFPKDFDEEADKLDEDPEDKAERERKNQVLADREARKAAAAAEAAAAAQEGKKGKGKKKQDQEEEEVQEVPEQTEMCLIRMSLETQDDRDYSETFSARILQMCKQVNGNQPLFNIRLITNTDQVIFEPLLEEVEDAVKSVYEGFFNETQDILGVGDKLFPLLNLRAFELSQTPTGVARSELPVEVVHRLMTENKKGPRQLLAMYESFDYLLRVEIDTFVDEFKASKPTQDDFAVQLEQLASDIERIQNRSLDEVNFEMIRVECQAIKRSLITKAQDISNALCNLLGNIVHDRCQQTEEEFAEIYAAIQAPVDTPEALHQLKLETEKVPSRVAKLQEVFATVTSANGLLNFHKYTTVEADFELYWKTYGWPQMVQQVLEDSEFRYKEYRHRFMNTLREDTEELVHELSELNNKVDQCSRWGSELSEHHEDYYTKVQRLRQQIDECERKIKLYNSREELFNMPVTNHTPVVKELKTTFEPYEQLWTIVNGVNSKWEIWMGTPFEALPTDEMEQCIVTWAKTLNQLSRKIKEEAPQLIAAKFAEQVKEFQPQLPLIHALRHLTNPKHWKEVADLVGGSEAKLKPTTFTPKDIGSLPLMDHLPEIEEVAERAEKADKLERQLEAMKGEWQHIQYQLEPHSDTFILKEVDDIQAKLDEHSIKTQSMLGSQHVKDIKARVEAWEKKLKILQDIQDEWLKCQQSWVYLEPIFGASDIQKALPLPYMQFTKVDKLWHEVLEATKRTPYVMIKAEDPELHQKFKGCNDQLENVLKELYKYLETKRMAFPRFYFISNEALLEILSESQEPTRVQKYLAKCFEGIKSLRFRENLDIDQMISPEGEVLDLVKPLNPADSSNQVELWLQKVENQMRDTVRDYIRRAVEEYVKLTAEGDAGRVKFILDWPGQIVIAICCLYWTLDTEERLKLEQNAGLQRYAAICEKQKNDLVLRVRGKLTKVQRCTLQALLIIEVHNETCTRDLRDAGVDDATAFDWLAQLRYYWEGGELLVRQTNAQLSYGYEYLGNTGRLVITPLTDRCYRTLTSALHLNYGGAPEGPAGTGKTETTKDLSKAIAKHCVVMNCSDQCDYKMMGTLFRGLAQAGSWTCLDEFNRIEVQVLSVVAQQIGSIQFAIKDGKVGGHFDFEGQTIPLKSGATVFITMNPGYAGRAELPDNLKALFRPVAMMVPDYSMIGEIMLYSCGYLEAGPLAKKIVTTYKLCSESLSSQSHYDYGMRAVISVLRAAARAKQSYPEQDEAILVLKSIQDVNLAKFLSPDVPLFKNIISDLFPGIELPPPDYEDYRAALLVAAEHYNLQFTPYFDNKCFEVMEMVNVRHGLMVVGMSVSGKSMVLKSLAHANTTLHGQGLPKVNPENKTHICVINPKSITMGQLYGQVDAAGDWSDGILAKNFRTFAEQTTPDRKWLVLDGPVDAIWIENMNTVLDDNKKLCLVNGDIISMSGEMNMIFEVQDLLVASPATVSRCGMIYFEPEQLGWECLFASWMHVLPEGLAENEEAIKIMRTLVEWLVEPALTCARRQCKRYIQLWDNFVMMQFLKFWLTWFHEFEEDEETGKKPWHSLDDSDVQKLIEGSFVFTLAWTVAGCLDQKSRVTWDGWLKEELGLAKVGEGGEKKKKKEDAGERPHKFLVNVPEKALIFEMAFVRDGLKFTDWLDTLEQAPIPEDAQYQQIIVPTTDTARYAFLLKTSIENNLPIMLVGDTGTGKTILVKDMLSRGLDREKYVNLLMQFSAQTSANQVQSVIDNKVDKRRKGVYGPPIGKKMLIFIDDLNMPQQETFGAQPPIEIIRQWMDHRGWYEHTKQSVDFRELQDVLFIAAMGPPGGGRSEVTPRLPRHFQVISLPPFDNASMKMIFGKLMDWMITRPGFSASLRGLTKSVVDATVDIFNTVSDKLLPTPEKSHYTFNLRDVWKVLQGVSIMRPLRLQDPINLYRVWVHENYRVYFDRLIDDADRKWFKELIGKTLKENFKMDFNTVVTREPLLYADFLERNVEDRVYEELEDLDNARKTVEDYLDLFNQTARKKMPLVIFTYVLEHVARISRVIKLPFGHCLLIGVGGSGRQSCTRLAAHISEFKTRQGQVTKGYSRDNWLGEIKEFLKSAGRMNEPAVFLVNDTQIVEEEFLEDLCNILNTGEVPNLMEAEDIEEICEGIRQAAKDAGYESHSKEGIMKFFVDRCRVLCHVVMAFSPVGDTLRHRLRQFPSLVNCTTIDWFTPWPSEGLKIVASSFLEDVQMAQDQKDAAVDCCVAMHRESQKMAAKYQAEARISTYVTPTSYLELINTYKKLLANKKQEISQAKHRYDRGLEVLAKTEQEVDDKQEELELLKPNLKRTMAETAEAEKDIAIKKDEANEIKARVAKDEEETAVIESGARKLQQTCSDELSQATPALEQAMEAVRNIDKGQLTLVKSMGSPPNGVKVIMSAVCVLFGETVKPKKDASGKMQDEGDLFWDICKKKVMGDLTKFVANLLSFADTMGEVKDMERRIETVRAKYFTQKEFKDMKEAKKASEALVGVVKWVQAAELAYRTEKKVRPMKEQLAIAEADLAKAQAALAEKQKAKQEADDRVAALQAELDEKKRKGKELQDQFEDTSAKLERALKLVKGLASEKGRYREQSEILGGVFKNIPGDVILSAGQIAYLGPFTNKYRGVLLAGWMKLCKEKKIPGTDPFSLERFLGDPLKIQQWKISSLPGDAFSVDNAVMMANTNRWPLLIDPQMQANNWIKNMERNNNLQTVRPEGGGDYLSTLEKSLSKGYPVLMENIGETLDPALEPLLLKQKFKDGGQWSILLGEKAVEYNEKFRLFITTKLPRPHYKPEVSTKVSCIAFMITLQGLTDQLLGKIVSYEEKELDDKKKKAVTDSASFKQKLADIEDSILKQLTGAETTDQLLASEEIIITLDYSAKTSEEIKNKMADIQLVEQRFGKVQQTFMQTATPGSSLFFCIDQLANIDPMYQYSLQFYMDLFQKGLEMSRQQQEQQESLEGQDKPRWLQINEYFFYSLYKKICLSLFAKDRLLFSFRMSIALGEADMNELRFVMTGGVDEKPGIAGPEWLPDMNWQLVWRAQQQLGPAFKSFANKFSRPEKESLWRALFLDKSPETIMLPDREGHAAPLPDDMSGITDLQKLVVLRCLRSDKMVPAVTQYVINDKKLGLPFTDPPIFDLEQCYGDSPDPWVPMIFVLSRGADPGTDLNLLAEKEGKKDQFAKLSLGQGQGTAAQKAIEEAKTKGSWVLLQNCHLYADWMPEMQRIIEKYSVEDKRQDPKFLNPGFRLWLTAMPSDCFPREVLQNGVKMVLEPPKGLRSNLKRSYSSAPINNPKFFNGCNKEREWKKLLYGLCFFHSIIQERRAFGPLGWNIPYEFNDTDLRISVQQLQMFLNESAEVPLAALLYLISECNYGGRVTDDRDRRCLQRILDTFFCEGVWIEEDYKFSPSGAYIAPPDGDHQFYVDFISSLPAAQPPEIFGLHPNADITREEFETKLLLDSCLSTLPRDTGGGDDSEAKADPKTIVARLAKDIKENLAPPFDTIAVNEKYPTDYNQSMNTVLFQECVRFNRLISLLHSTLGTLQRAIKGEVVMSAELDGVFTAMFDSKIPALWMKKSYPSLKPLGAYIDDLRRRIQMLSDWMDSGPPPVFWIPGFFFPQAFLTGVQQNYARAKKLEIDKLDWNFEVTDLDPKSPDNTAPAWGCYVYGLFMEGAGFDRKKKVMCEQQPKEIFQEFPVMFLKPCMGVDAEWKLDPSRVYMCPVYRTTDRRGVLMTTGHSTNYVMPWYLDVDINASPPEPPSHWVKRGTALFCSLPY